MNENSSEKDFFLSIDQDLKDMASDIPDMPDSFRSGWRRAIRADAKSKPENREFLHPESAVPPENTSNKTPIRHSRRWTYLLSAAAALIFLVTGTLATRGMLSPRLKEKAPDMSTSILSAGEEKSISPATGSPQQTGPAPYDAGFEEDAAVLGSQYALEEESAVSWDSVESAVEEYEEYPEEKNYSASTHASVSKSDSMVQNEIPAAEQTPASVDPPAEESLGTRIVWFFEDMGAFVLAALPYMAVAGVLLLIIILIKRKR